MMEERVLSLREEVGVGKSACQGFSSPVEAVVVRGGCTEDIFEWIEEEEEERRTTFLREFSQFEMISFERNVRKMRGRVVQRRACDEDRSMRMARLSDMRKRSEK